MEGKDSIRPFLMDVAKDLYESFGNDLDDLCLVFPNRRAGLFFNKYLAEKLKQPVWSPTIYTIQDLMSRLSLLEYADDLELISRLYKVYSGVRRQEESFDEFFFWGEIMLSDFDEIDKYLVDPADIFRNLTELKDLDKSFEYLSEEQMALIERFWSSFNTEQFSEQKQQFLDIWIVLEPVYNKFRESLQDSGVGFEGMIYRNVAENIGGGLDLDLPFSKLVFIGFNALNPCEQKLFSFLQRSGRALFYWDYDEFYLESEVHEAGRFMRQNLSTFSDSGKHFSKKNLAGPGKNIHVYSIPSDAGQAQIVHSILEDAGKNKPLGEETAIVLADEELLIPVLHALPEDLEEINVTMGYPVSATPVFSLIEHLIALQRNIREDKGREVRFYYGDVMPILQHQYITLRERLAAAEIVRKINEQNLIYLNASDLAINELLSLIFHRIERPEDIAGYLLSVLEIITGGENDVRVPALELEFIYRIYTRIKRLKDVLGRLELNFTIPTFLRLFHKFLQRTRIPFSGEPLAGIQVMGVLETRVLDFDRVILLSINEGAFPKSGVSVSFIPHNLRLGFNLPTLEYQDAIYAYYFYRLLQRSEDVFMIYNNKAEGLNTGEKSRFIYQMKYDPVFKLNQWSAGFDVQSTSPGSLRAEKTALVMDRLMEYTHEKGSKRYLSPSALNSYIDCPLQFYFKYIADIREPVELTEEIDPALFGTILHESVRKIYQSLDNPIRADALQAVLNSPSILAEAIDDSFREIFFQDASKGPEGRNLVIREIILSYVVRILEKDAEYCPIQIHSLEDSYYMDLAVQTGKSRLSIRIGGKIDRVDMIRDEIRVLDYKTGAGTMYLGSVEELFESTNRNRNRAAFQTFLYARLLLLTEQAVDKPVLPGVYLVRELFSQEFRYYFSLGTPKNNIPVRDYSDLDEEFSHRLTQLLAEMFNPELSFVQTEQEATCRNCPFRGICHR